MLWSPKIKGEPITGVNPWPTKGHPQPREPKKGEEFAQKWKGNPLGIIKPWEPLVNPKIQGLKSPKKEEKNNAKEVWPNSLKHYLCLSLQKEKSFPVSKALRPPGQKGTKKGFNEAQGRNFFALKGSKKGKFLPNAQPIKEGNPQIRNQGKYSTKGLRP